MKTPIVVAIILALTGAGYAPTFAQSSEGSPVRSGQITYEVVRKIDPSSMRIMINGETVKPGDPNFPTDIPDTRTFSQKVLFDGKYVKENRDEQNTAVRTVIMGGPGGGGAPQTTNVGRPFEEQVFVDLSGQKVISVLTIGKEKDAKTYRADTPIQRTNGWQLTDQTKKIAGYTCRKATIPFRKETYTVWFTTELPFAYSPVHELTPETGVVLLIEANREQFRATKVSLSAVAAKDVEPTTQAEMVQAAQLDDMRQKARADFQQQMMMG